jgi:hypothetical protein
MVRRLVAVAVVVVVVAMVLMLRGSLGCPLGFLNLFYGGRNISCLISNQSIAGLYGLLFCLVSTPWMAVYHDVITILFLDDVSPL